MSDEKQVEKSDVDLAVSVDQAKPARRRAAPAPKSAVDQVKADMAARAEAMPVTPAAPDSDRLPAHAGSGIHDAFGMELPTQEQFVQAGGKAEDYDGYVVSRCSIKPESAVAADASEAPKVVGKAKAEQILADAFRRRTGQSIEPALRDEDLKEDWHEVQVGKRPPVDQDLAGLYIVTHGTIFFHKDKIVPKGRKVMLSAEDAKAFLELEMVRPLRTAA